MKQCFEKNKHKFKLLLKILLKILKVLENFNKIFEFSPAIEAYCWLRRGLFPILCKFSGVSGAFPPFPLDTPLCTL